MSASHPASRNVRTVAKLEEASLPRPLRSGALQRLADGLCRHAGLSDRPSLHHLRMARGDTGWLTVEPIDPFPFHLLTLCLAVEALLLEIFVLMNQNRMTRDAHRRAHLDLQINLLAEQEMTYALQMLRKICEHLHLDVESHKADVLRLMEKTDVNKLLDELGKEGLQRP